MMRIVEGSSARENSPIDPFGGAKGFDLYAGDTKKERIEVLSGPLWTINL